MGSSSKKRKKEKEEETAGTAPAADTAAAKKAKTEKKDKKDKKKKEKKPKREADSDNSDVEMSKNKSGLDEEDEELMDLPPSEILLALVDRIEAQLPKDDVVKFDSRAKKLDWNKVAWEQLDAENCKKIWNYIQDRIRRFRILAEMMPDARTWISQPWTNFYKSKDHNRHPDMPKKPLSMYMLFYSEMREEVQKINPKMSMPEVAKACSEKYSKLSDKKKAQYKARCEEMRREYEAKLAQFYIDNPQLKPVKPDKKKHSSAAAAATAAAAGSATVAATTAAGVVNINTPGMILQQAQQQQQQQYATSVTMNSGIVQQQPATVTYTPQGMAMQQPMQQQYANNVVTITPQQQQQQIYQQQPQQQQPPIVAQAIAAVTAANNDQQQQQQQIVQYQQYNQQQQPMTIPITFKAEDQMQPVQLQLATGAAQMQPLQTIQQPQTVQYQPQPQQPAVQQQQPAAATTVKHQQSAASNSMLYPDAPERPPKPFDLYVKSVMDAQASQPNFDRHQCMENCRQTWKTMKDKKKAKWISMAQDKFMDYEELVSIYMRDHPGYTPPDKKNFLTHEDQKVLDKAMGRPEKPPSSAYSLFSKEMLNNPQIKQFPSKERMTQISNKWKVLDQTQKDYYQEQVNQSMGVYRQQYENWLEGLTERQKQIETARGNTAKNKMPKPAAPGKMPPMAKDTTQQQQLLLAGSQPIQAATVNVVAAPAGVAPEAATSSGRDPDELRQAVLSREPVEPARSSKQLFIADWLKKPKNKKKKVTDAKTEWKKLDKKERKKWQETLDPLRQKYIEDYTVFVRALDKEELEMYTELKAKRDEDEEKKRANESSDSDESESSESESDSDSDSESD